MPCAAPGLCLIPGLTPGPPSNGHVYRGRCGGSLRFFFFVFPSVLVAFVSTYYIYSVVSHAMYEVSLCRSFVVEDASV